MAFPIFAVVVAVVAVIAALFCFWCCYKIFLAHDDSTRPNYLTRTETQIGSSSPHQSCPERGRHSTAAGITGTGAVFRALQPPQREELHPFPNVNRQNYVSYVPANRHVCSITTESEILRRDKAYDDQIRSLQEALTKKRNKNGRESNDKIISKAQSLLFLNHLSHPNSMEKPPYLIIGVDATPAILAGYCVDLVDMTLSYYVVKRDDSPWSLRESNNSAEFETKNLRFALALWAEEIMRYKSVAIYTDNFAIKKMVEQHGISAGLFLQHLIRCERVVVTNWRSMVVNKYQNLEAFVKFIKPADDLSRWKIDEAVEFLTEYYGISMENVEGTHRKGVRKTPRVVTGRRGAKRPASVKSSTLRVSLRRKPWYNQTAYYKLIKERVLKHIQEFDCVACGEVLKTASLKMQRFG